MILNFNSTLVTKFLYILTSFTLLIVLFSSCGQERNAPDVSHIELDYDFVRYDQLLFPEDTLSVGQHLDSLHNMHPYLSEMYFRFIIPIISPESDEMDPYNPQLVEAFTDFVIFSPIIKLQDEITQQFPVDGSLGKEFDQAFSFLAYYYPEYPTPNVYTVLTEYAYAVFLYEDGRKDGLGIGLDMFLGDQYPYRKYNPQSTKFSAYQTRTFNRDHIVRKAMMAIAEDKMIPSEGDNFIDHLIDEGKKIYFLKQMMPYAQDSVIYEFSRSQMDWVSENELQMWAYVLDESMLFKSSRERVVKYLKPAPTSQNMPAESPGRALTYNGYRIILEYMKRNPDISLQELMENRDAKGIFEASRYKPKR